jgi:tripartite-type tricarboxylate transporter receptor subunit TctC
MIRTLVAVCAAVSSLFCAVSPANAQGYPKSPITLVVPLAPGDAADTTARALAEDLGRQLKVPVILSNKPGAGGAIGVSSVVGSKKDGYTLLFAQNSPLTIRRVLEPSAAAYDPLKDLTALGLTTRTPSILVVRSDSPFKDFRSFAEHAKKTPGGVRIGTAGSGSAGDVSVNIINSLTGAETVSVPYKGAGPAVTDLLGGQIEAVVLGLGAVSTHLKSGSLKGIAISTKFPELPQVPTLGSLGYKQELQGVWFAFFAPNGVPPEVTRTLVPALERATKNSTIAAQLLPMGILQDYAAPDKVLAEIAKEYQSVSTLMKQSTAKK